MTAAAIEGGHAARHDLDRHLAGETWLTLPIPAAHFTDTSTPIYAALVAELGVPGQDIGPGPVVEAEPVTPKTVAKPVGRKGGQA